MADEVYDRLYYAGARARRAGAFDSAQGDARRRGDGGAFVLEELLHDRMARRLAGRRGATLAAKATQLNEFIVSHAPTFAQKAGETALAEGEPELRRMLERLKENRDLCLDALRGVAGRDGAEAGRRVLSVPADRGADGFVRFLPPAAGGDARRTRAGCGFRRGRRGLDPHLLRGGTVDPRARHGAVDQVFEKRRIERRPGT